MRQRRYIRKLESTIQDLQLQLEIERLVSKGLAIIAEAADQTTVPKAWADQRPLDAAVRVRWLAGGDHFEETYHVRGASVLECEAEAVRMATEADGATFPTVEWIRIQ